MKGRNIFWIIAGALNTFTAVLHTIGGQLSLVNPLLDSNLNSQVKAEWLGAWHMVTIVLFFSSYYLLKISFSKTVQYSKELVWFIGILYILFGIPSIFSSLALQAFAPQWILLMPIGVLALLGLKKMNTAK